MRPMMNQKTHSCSFREVDGETRQTEKNQEEK